MQLAAKRWYKPGWAYMRYSKGQTEECGCVTHSDLVNEILLSRAARAVLKNNSGALKVTRTALCAMA